MKEGIRASYRLGHDDFAGDSQALARSYYQLGMIAEGDDYLDISTAPITVRFEQFMERAFALKYAGRIGELRTLVEDSMSDPELGIERQPEWVNVDIGQLQITVGDYEAGIVSMEIPFDVMSLEIVDYNDPGVAIPIMQTLAFAYTQVGRSDESRQLLTALQTLLDEISDSGYATPNHFAKYALNRALLGDAVGARQNFKTAVDAGFRDYYGINNDPVWAGTLRLPGFSELLDEMKRDLDRQRALVKRVDAEDGFRTEVRKLFLTD